MPHAVTPISVTPIEHGPDSKCHFGVEVRGVDFNEELPQDVWDQVKDLVFLHKVVVFKDQGKLHPSKQLNLVKRYCGGEAVGMHSKDPKGFQLRSGPSVTLAEVPQLQVVGCGVVPEGHYGMDGKQVAQRTSKHLYKTPLTKEEEEAGIVRLVQLHFDSSLYEIEPPQVGSLLCVLPPVGEDLTLRMDNGSEGTKKISPGATVYFDMSHAYDLLTPAQKSLVDNSRVAYAPRAFTWMSTTHFTEDGAGIYTEGKETSLEDVPAWEEKHCKIYPMVWKNPLNGQKSLMIHGQAAWKLYLKDSPEAEERVVEDLAEVRSIVRELQTPFLKAEMAYAHGYEAGDLLIWYNMGLMHSATEFPYPRMGSRIMHQINVSHAKGPEHGTVADVRC